MLSHLAVQQCPCGQIKQSVRFLSEEVCMCVCGGSSRAGESAWEVAIFILCGFLFSQLLRLLSGHEVSESAGKTSPCVDQKNGVWSHTEGLACAKAQGQQAT